VPTMYTLFARQAIPGANTAEVKDEPSHGSSHGSEATIAPEYISK